MHVYIGSDHGGFELKSQLLPFLETLGYQTTDIGSATLDAADDYPDIAMALDQRLKQDQPSNWRAILICGSGIGMCIAANKLSGVRAVCAIIPEMAYFGRLHNNINVLCLAGLRSNLDSIENITDGNYTDLLDAGMRPANVSEAKRIVHVFLETPTQAKENSRHLRRIDKLTDLENIPH